MRRMIWILILLLFCPAAFAATKQEGPPDQEMLKLMELLRDWEMIKNLDLMRQLGTLEQPEGSVTEPRDQTTQRGSAKDKPR